MNASDSSSSEGDIERKSVEDFDTNEQNEEASGLDYSFLLSSHPGMHLQPQVVALPKSVLPDGSEIQHQLTEQALCAMQSLLAEPITINLKSCAEAVWLDEQGLAEVRLNRGTFHLTMGRQSGSKLFLLQEEALYLLARGSLLLHYRGAPLSLMDSHRLIIKGDPHVLMVQVVYDYLKRLGFILARHGLGFMPTASTSDATPASAEYIDGRQSMSLPLSPVMLEERQKRYMQLFQKLQQDFKRPTVKSCEPLLPFFDVYKPKQRFRKSDPGPPDFYLVVTSEHDSFPEGYQIMQLLGRLKTVHFAVVSIGSISFFEIA